MTKVAVVAHTGKSMGGGLLELRRVLEAEGVTAPQWYEVEKSKYAPKQVKRALKNGAELVFAWGGDGLVQQCIDVLAGSKARLAILPAGTANLLATNLGIPKEIEPAVRIGLGGARRKLDVGTVNGEHFAVMAGTGFDARMIGDADGRLKDTLGRAAYVFTGSKNLRIKPFKATIRVDDAHWYSGKASCILVGNVGKLFGGIEVFADSHADDGQLELGVVTADGLVEWTRTIARTAAGSPSKSPFVLTTKARTIEVELSRKVLYELDGGERTKTKRLLIEVEPGAVEVCVPVDAEQDGAVAAGPSRVSTLLAAPRR
jgi:YegS/Rv2252/BmrU family lipid kinase